ncbi:hypothetical protein ISN44_As07g004240 [Arabidopsis suecica]|uniref:Uncharacterized protein n=1 Tax=Arabidopsis suecica TaxID=45249 RepID=A0A8T2BNS1_ARASU|nr:hypothetical protein ISN44_As07g004240 [Arabidopsis suecica]KAG7588069.1 hypothetical protein ISN44_As07g004240 [Arabidopsis suecica]
MRPETLKVIQQQLTAMKAVQETKDDEEVKKIMDEYMFCFRNCYTVAEIVNHITQKIPSSVPAEVRNFCQGFIAVIDKDLRDVYLKDAEDCASERMSQARDTSEEAKRSQGEASTSHKCEPNCDK